MKQKATYNVFTRCSAEQELDELERIKDQLVAVQFPQVCKVEGMTYSGSN
jgi:hypothetical protein